MQDPRSVTAHHPHQREPSPTRALFLLDQRRARGSLDQPRGQDTRFPFVAIRSLRLRGGWVDPLSLLDSLQYLAGYLVHFAPSNSLLLFKSADSESSNHPTDSAPYGNLPARRSTSAKASSGTLKEVLIGEASALLGCDAEPFFEVSIERAVLLFGCFAGCVEIPRLSGQESKQRLIAFL